VTGEIVRRVDVEATNVSFVLLPRHLVLTGPADLLVRDWHPCRYHLRGPIYILRVDRETYNGALTSGVEIGDEGVAAFEVVAEVSERCVSVCPLKWPADIIPTVSRLPGGQATASSIPAQSTD